MTIYQKVKNYLELEPRGRSRANKDRGMVNLLLQDYPELKEVQKEQLIAFCRDFESHTRLWRQVLQENPELRSDDYEDKEVLEQEKQIELGYEAGYKQSVDKLGRIK